MSKFRATAVALLVGASLGSTPFVAPLSAAPVAEQTACKKATIGGQSKCIAAGQFCAKRHEKDYNKNGYTCNKKDVNGRWHLRKK